MRIFKVGSPQVRAQFENSLAVQANNLYEDAQVAFIFADGHLIEVIFE